jgi:hypothetical protein
LELWSEALGVLSAILEIVKQLKQTYGRFTLKILEKDVYEGESPTYASASHPLGNMYGC